MSSIKIPRITTWIVGANAAVWLLLVMLSFCVDSETFVVVLGDVFELPSSLWLALHRPWTMLTYAFAQLHPLHLLLNCVVIAWTVSVLTERLNFKRIIGVYVCGALSGAVVYIFSSWLVGESGGTLIGASASAMALVGSLAVIAPNGRTSVLPGIELTNKWICISLIIIDVILSISPFNAARMSHLGGAAGGTLLSMLFLRHSLRTPSNRSIPEHVVNKVRQSGFSSLTEKERKQIFNRH